MLVSPSGLAVVVAVAHYQQPNEPWGGYVIMLVLPDSAKVKPMLTVERARSRTNGMQPAPSQLFPSAIATARLRLRHPRPDDAEAMFHRYASSPEVTRYMSFPTHRSVDDTKAYLASTERTWAAGTDFPYVIERAEDGLLVGGTGLHIEEPHRYCTGYLLARDAWGKGYATEALAALLELAFSRPRCRRVYALCDGEHVASARVLEKCGMQREGVLRRHSVLPNLSDEPRDMLCYARVR